MKNIGLQPNRVLYLSVRAAFIRQGTLLAAWCRTHKYNHYADTKTMPRPSQITL